MGAYLCEMFLVSLLLTIAVELAVVLLCTRITIWMESRKKKGAMHGKGGAHDFLPAVREKRGLLPVILVNVLTNPPAVLLCLLGRLYLPETAGMVMKMPVGMPEGMPAAFPLQIIVETAVVAVEAYVYRSFAKDSRWGICHPVRLSVTANLCSWLCGIGLMAFGSFFK